MMGSLVEGLELSRYVTSYCMYCTVLYSTVRAFAQKVFDSPPRVGDCGASLVPQA